MGDLSQDTIGGGTPKTSVTEFWNGEIPWIQSSDLANDKLYGVLPKKFITEDAVKNSATKLIPANSIAIVTRVGVGKLAFMPYEFASSQDFLSLSNLQVDCNFGMYSIYKMLQRELNNIQGTSIKGITKADLLDKKTFVPIKVEEQQKIGSFFKQLDDTIALHQRKLESFQFTYHEIIRRLFLKKAKWQLTKLSDLVTILDKNRKPVKKEDRLLGDTPYYGANGIQDYISGFTHKGEFILIAEDGANSLTEYPIYFVKGQIWVNNHAHVLKVNRDVSPLFLALALKQINYSKYTVGSSRNKLNLKDLENIAIFIPDNNEQQKIGDCKIVCVRMNDSLN